MIWSFVADDKGQVLVIEPEDKGHLKAEDQGLEVRFKD